MSMEKRGNNKWRFRKTKRGIPYYLNFEGTEKQAQKAHTQFLVDVDRGNMLPNSTMTLNDLFELYVDEFLVPAKRRLPTIMSYKRSYTLYIRPVMGDMRIEDISTYHVQRTINKMITGGYGSCTIVQVRKMMSAIFNKAVLWKLLKENPVVGVDAPSIAHNNYVELLTIEQIKVLIRAIEECPDKKYKLAFSIAFSCGLRESEVLALNIDDLDFTSNILSVEKQWGKKMTEDFTETWAMVPPKSDNSIRKIHMTEIVRNAARERIAEMQNTVMPISKLLFYSERTGRPISPQSLNNHLKKMLESYNLPVLTFHSLRHLQASMLEQLGTDQITMAHRLGDRVETIRRYYFNRVEYYEEKAVEKIDDFIQEAIHDERASNN